MVEVSPPPPLRTNREIFEDSFSGAQDRPVIPNLRSDSPSHNAIPHSLCEFREQEGTENRERRLYALWKHLPHSSYHGSDTVATRRPQLSDTLTLHSGEAETMRKIYDDELLGRCCGGGHMADGRPTHIQWPEFRKYAESKEAELWSVFHDELDLDGNGYLDSEELRIALSKAGIKLSSADLAEFMMALTSSPHPHAVNFREFRRFMGDVGHGAARETMEGDVSLSADDKPPPMPSSWKPTEYTPVDDDDHTEEDAEGTPRLASRQCGNQLLLGGRDSLYLARARPPSIRLKVFLITRPPEMGGTALRPKPGVGGLKAIGGAVARIYAEGGFLAYESAKRAFARHRDRVSDSRDISGSSRFLAGGIGGITSQLSIYPIETLKVEQQTSRPGDQKRSFVLGGIRAFYRGLHIGLVGVFPYSAIDMSTFEALKLAYMSLAYSRFLAFGSVSGSVGATSVYPLNLVRTRLQASGSSGHPERYTGVRDVIIKTYQRDWLERFLQGAMSDVVPSVSISYLVYEQSRRKLGV
ncbi:mitochondrial carrier domain-containing protein [Pisolithus microcarpus]|nr:mitochondrial carrier domain-containing protein [Pisolithus microcarpus]